MRKPLVLVLLAVLASFGTMQAAKAFRSPGQAAAEARPPSPSPITAKVERRTIEFGATVRGKVVAEKVIDVPAVPGSVVSQVGAQSGDSVSPGSVLIELNGRPLILMTGEFPFWRDLKEGDVGKDVAQLQRSLNDLGFSTADSKGVFGVGTTRAVARLYRTRAYLAPISPDPAGSSTGGSDADRKVSEARLLAKTEMERAMRVLAEAETNYAADQAPSSAEAVLRAKEDLEITRLTQTNAVTVAEEAAQVDDVRAGSFVARSELVFIPPGAATVIAAPTATGTAAADHPIMQIAAGPTVVAAELPVGAFKAEPGMNAVVIDDNTNLKIKGAITSIASTGDRPVVIAGEGLDSIVGQDVRVSVTARVSEMGLVVPTAGLFTRSDGLTVIRRLTDNGSIKDIVVEVPFESGGWSEVRPRDKALKPGDQVVLGYEQD